MVLLLPIITFVIRYYYLCNYIIISYHNCSTITYYYRNNMDSLLPIITRSIIGSNGFIITMGSLLPIIDLGISGMM